ncbi:hypothetical protein MTO96_001659 [Rhipicephalus appendiculatus]
MEVQVSVEDISPEEFLDRADWRTIGSNIKPSCVTAQNNSQMEPTTAPARERTVADSVRISSASTSKSAVHATRAYQF